MSPRSASTPASWSCTATSGRTSATRSSSPTRGQRAMASLVHATLDEGVATARAKVRRHRQLVITLRIAFAVVMLGSWEILSRTKIIDPFFFGRPSEIGHKIWVWATVGTPDGPLWDQVWITMEEALLGFGIGVGAGIIFGLALGRIRLLAEVLGSIIIIWLGLGLPSKVALAFVLVFFVVFFNAFQGVREVNEDVIANARILGANRRKVTTQVVLPSALTWIIASLHISFGFALVGAVVGEFIGSIHGLGHLIASAQGTFDTNGVFAAMFILAVIALAAEFLITTLENRLITWRPSRRDEVAL